MAYAATMNGDATDAPAPRRSLLVGGGAAGVAGGIVMYVWMILSAALDGRQPLAQVRRIGLTFLGPDTVETAVSVILYGLVLHLAVSAVVGILFTALLPPGFPYLSAFIIGVGYAWLAMSISTSLVLPAVNPVLRESMPALGGSWVLAHAAYGVVVGFGPWLRRPRASRRER